MKAITIKEVVFEDQYEPNIVAYTTMRNEEFILECNELYGNEDDLTKIEDFCKRWEEICKFEGIECIIDESVTETINDLKEEMRKENLQEFKNDK